MTPQPATLRVLPRLRAPRLTPEQRTLAAIARGDRRRLLAERHRVVTRREQQRRDNRRRARLHKRERYRFLRLNGRHPERCPCVDCLFQPAPHFYEPRVMRVGT